MEKCNFVAPNRIRLRTLRIWFERVWYFIWMLPRHLTIYRFNLKKRAAPCSGQFLTWFNSLRNNFNIEMLRQYIRIDEDIAIRMLSMPLCCLHSNEHKHSGEIQLWNDVSIFWRRLILHYPLLTLCLLIEMNNVCAFDTIIESILKWNSPHYYGSWSEFICISQTFSFWRLIWNSSAHLPKPMQCTGTKTYSNPI